MTTLIRTEWLKMRKYSAFWWIMSITALAYPGINFIYYIGYNDIMDKPTQASQYAKMMLGNPFAFPEVWHTVAYSSSLFVFIPAVMIIMLITNEYTYKTHRQNIIDGWSRNQFLTSKLIDVALITLIITFLYALVCIVTGLITYGSPVGSIWQQSYYTGLFALQTFAQLSLAFLAGFLVRKAFLALGIFLFYFIVLENIIEGILTWKNSPAAPYLPLEISDRLIPRPGFTTLFKPEGYQESLDAIPLHVLLTILITLIIWLICYRINNRKDLK
ncbi:MAG: ABC transporter permease [Chitinophagaceae bacterium]